MRESLLWNRRRAAGVFLLLFQAACQAIDKRQPADMPADGPRDRASSVLDAAPANEYMQDVEIAPVRWVRANARPLRPLTDTTDFTDLAFLDTALRGKRIVQLGESSHGVAEYSMAKVRLVRYLHERLGFNLIVFEGPVFECMDAGAHSRVMTAEDAMARCAFAVWQADEVLPLFAYVRATQHGKRPARLLGIDSQSGYSASTVERPAVLRNVAARLDSTVAQRAYETDSAFVSSWLTPAASGRTGQWITSAETGHALAAHYDTLASWMARNESGLISHGVSREYLRVLRRSVEATSALIQHSTGSPYRGTADPYSSRDAVMAANLAFLLDSVYPGEKAIVWAHNLHVRHAGELSPFAKDRPMGSFLAASRRNELFTVGFYAHHGRVRANDGTVWRLEDVEPESLEGILHQSGHPLLFADIRKGATAGKSDLAIDSWLEEPVAARIGIKSRTTIVPRSDFDGLLFIDEVGPAVRRVRERPYSCCRDRIRELGSSSSNR